ncbi:MAG: CapA family protein [Muribaculaceae bacterium]
MKKTILLAVLLTISVVAISSCRNGSATRSGGDASLPDSAAHPTHTTPAEAHQVSQYTGDNQPSLHHNHDSIYSIVGVGDVMMGINYPDTAMLLTADDGATLFEHVKPYISAADVAVCNLEGVLLDTGGEPKKVNDEEALHLFRMPERYAQLLNDAGFDFVSIANNHSRDFGEDGLHSTMQALSDVGLNYAGVLGSCETAIVERRDVKFGFIAIAPNALMVPLKTLSYTLKLVKQLNSKCDVVIVSAHAGAEGNKFRHVTRDIETYFGENRGNIYAAAHALIDAGADVVFAHGPHVSRAIELYKNRFIAYSLGNFCTPYGVNILDSGGHAPLVDVAVSNKGEFINGRIVPFVQYDRTGPQKARSNTVIDDIIALSKEDFPESPLFITPDGIIKRKQ